MCVCMWCGSGKVGGSVGGVMGVHIAHVGGSVGKGVHVWVELRNLLTHYAERKTDWRN